jgi:hypothetical protein
VTLADPTLKELCGQLDRLLDPGSVCALDVVVVVCCLLQRQQQPAVLAERLDHERELATQHPTIIPIADVVLGEDPVHEVVKQTQDDVRKAGEMAVEDGPWQSCLLHHVIDREIAKAALLEHPRRCLDDLTVGSLGGDAGRASTWWARSA